MSREQNNFDLFAPPPRSADTLEASITQTMQAVATAPSYVLAIEPSIALKKLIASRTAHRGMA